ncbi:hypothetical protein ACMU_02400 [Actibacterium mucosum KCTC 23349]|uniref:Uncharacterized protein n=1 Tax=Actibacterium mucosum KCTC 23349 TaxID=1454373 RepID=A0A037ZP95_9RHOB|nr:hypothetical protein ACMU_02400 [Actibacterium mucosum KCTC 23349]
MTAAGHGGHPFGSVCHIVGRPVALTLMFSVNMARFSTIRVLTFGFARACAKKAANFYRATWQYRAWQLLIRGI